MEIKKKNLKKTFFANAEKILKPTLAYGNTLKNVFKKIITVIWNQNLKTKR
jgi:hypothetical protein